MQRREAKAVFVALFIVLAAIVHASAIGWTVAAIGILNVLITPPGTGTIRLLTSVLCVVALAVSRQELQYTIAAVLWLVWPPTFMMAWGLGANRPAEPRRDSGVRPRATLAAIIAAVAVASVAFRLIKGGQLQQTAALFVGIPALLAIVVVLAVSPRSAVGVACKAVTVGLLVSVVILDEGFLCVAMSAPIFYLVAIGIAKSAESLRRRRDPGAGTFSPWMLLMLMVPMSLDGTAFTTFARDESVSESRIVHASAQDIQRALLQTPRFDRPLPFYLRAGFPRPSNVQIDRVRGFWSIQMRGGETRLNGTEPKTGDLILKLEEEHEGLVRWRAMSDSSHMTHFLTWREIVVTWKPLSDQTSRVTWTLRYRRGLDPAWYFGPMERYAVRLASGYLIDSIATP